MVYYKRFLQRLRKTELEVVCIELLPNITFELVKLVRLLLSVEFKDFHYHAYYGDLKDIIVVFVRLWEEEMDNAVKTADAVQHYNKQDYVDMLEQTINSQAQKQVFFGREVLPVNSLEEKEIYDQMNTKYKDYMAKITEIKAKADDTAERYFPLETIAQDIKLSLTRLHRIFECTNMHLASVLKHFLPNIKSSLFEIHRRIRKNLEAMREEKTNKTEEIRLNSYERNKELNTIARENYVNAAEKLTEVADEVRELRSAWEDDSKNTKPSIEILEEEQKYWEKKIKEIQEIDQYIISIDNEKKLFVQQQMLYKESDCGMPGLKTCYDSMLKSVIAYKSYLERKINEANYTLISHFAVRGFCRKHYFDNEFGPYIVDPYLQKIFTVDHGLHLRKFQCDGALADVPQSNSIEYYYDDFGSYHYNKKGEKIYQKCVTRSHYTLNDNDVLQKFDCKPHYHHISSKRHAECKVPNDIEIIPKSEPMSITGTLTKEVVKYLWDSLGAVLPKSLADVENRRPENPIHFLAHRLLVNKHGRTTKRMKDKQIESEAYRVNILNKRREKVTEALKAWKAKQFKRVKDLDDSEQWRTYYTQMGTLEFINQLNTDFLYSNTQSK